MSKGFTLVELIVTLGIFIAIGAVVFANFAGRKTNTDLTATTQQIATLLRQAESDAMAQEGDASWGVHFANATSTTPFYALFVGNYSTGTVKGQYPLPPSVAYKTSTLASGATLDIIFSAITGAPSASTSIGLYMPNESASFSSTISVASTGEVSY